MPHLKVSANRRFLVTADNRPFFYLGDTAWELFYRLNREEVDEYLADRAAKRFTVIQAVVLSEFGEVNRPNIYGEMPLVERDPARPNTAFFEHVDYVVGRAEQLGLFVGMLPAWGDQVGPTLWGKNPEIFTVENAYQYGQFLGGRYRDKPIIWVLGGDRPVETERQHSVWRSFAAGLKQGDGGTHLKTYHPHGGHSASEFLQEEPWLDFNMIQTSHGQRDGKTYELVLRDYEKSPIKPTMESEYCYEDHPVDWKPEQGRFDDYDARKGAYWSLFAGGHGFTYGCDDIFPFWQPGLEPNYYSAFHPHLPWREALQLPGAGQMRHARALMESRPFLTRIPDQSIVVSDHGVGSDHIQATRCSEGSYLFVYTAAGRPVTVDLSKLNGSRTTGYWYDPRQGTAAPLGEFSIGGTREFAPPSSGYGNDWVLVLDDAARDFPPPGDNKQG